MPTARAAARTMDLADGLAFLAEAVCLASACGVMDEPAAVHPSTSFEVASGVPPSACLAVILDVPLVYSLVYVHVMVPGAYDGYTSVWMTAVPR